MNVFLCKLGMNHNITTKEVILKVAKQIGMVAEAGNRDPGVLIAGPKTLKSGM